MRTTAQPKPTEAGNPDFRVWDGRQHIVGYIEAKPPTVENLEPVAETEQLRRYRKFPNLILTNFFEFRLYRNGELVAKARLARPFIATKLGERPPLEQVDELVALLEQFFAFSLPRVYSAESLAVELAWRTRFLRDQVVAEELAQEQASGAGPLLGFYEAFNDFLIAGLTLESFADLYAQTITYGLFAARVRAGEEFNRRAAFDAIPHTIGVLRDLFRFISLGELPRQLECSVDGIAEVLSMADVRGILHQFFHEGKGADPIVHFYETFLTKYDPEERERRGVYYTPEPVVSYIVRSLHQILQGKFGKADGLASSGVTLLDPAAGTMTFVAQAAKLAVEEFVGKYGEAGRKDFIRDHILENFYAFELMMAPYAVGHLKMGFSLEELGYQLSEDERFKLYLTNSLEMEELAESQLPGFSSLAQESHQAGAVKREVPILVILGNPPYSVSSANKSEFIEREMEAYKETVRDERNLMPLSDDYVKFIRFAEWKIAQAGQGVVGMITNHSYLDSPTFRGMRWHLMQTFDEIYVLDLHGNSLKKERCPDGSPDENVFDIRQGVAIALFICRGTACRAPTHSARTFRADLWGLRDKKYAWLSEHDWQNTDWQEVHPRPEFHPFVPRDEAEFEHYSKFAKLTDIFPVNSTGIKTHRDHFVFDSDREALKRRIRTFLDPNLPDELVRETFGLKDTHTWTMATKRKLLQQDGEWEKKIVPCLYRPFDIRWLFYHPHALDRSREEVMRHMLAGENLALVLMRQVSLDEPYTHMLATNMIVDNRTFVSARGITLHFPLYLYPDRRDLLSTHEPTERQPNLNPDVVAALAAAYGQEPSSEEIFYYVYAVLYAPTYREKYAEFLRLDFPRIPFTSDYELFKQMAELGKRLVELHLLQSPELDPPIARFQGEGDGKVQTGKKGLRYDAERERVYINEGQYFEGVPPAVWEYQIGGYQVCQKWLNDRADRQLSLDDIRTYCRLTTALSKTIETQIEIDGLYQTVERSPLLGSRNKMNGGDV
ncbi:DNA methyltransferase [Candidatus Bipolaricaulis anaerobius]|uniref:site-specific DNA-methyltransferase (adenine-specific) n=1 Tax=Candidatus Bipolaricaulis anaerobius TaxID=2026885 RepID=A0A2X3L394_9BACT|nr:type ISP restriction/modification enzyme [Candidatus Bipolaricaulis anaerobius]SQD93280.1 DNA methyltransferase [Candidatus Bipolaricaulis anaerobius]